jgi:uncharacterized protein YbjQ (UPF0145 family)
MESLIVLVFLLVLGYVAGSVAEKRHYRSIEKREADLAGGPIVTEVVLTPKNRPIKRAVLVSGSVVISIDYFKRILAGLQNFFGGNIGAYQTLVDRARREALLRMIEGAPTADLICNVRIETSAIGRAANRRKAVGSVECLAYGTAVFYK